MVNNYWWISFNKLSSDAKLEKISSRKNGWNKENLPRTNIKK